MDKQPAFLKSNDEDNPALGLRGIRMSLANPELFSIQLRAILRASFYGNVKIMYPMISDVQEVIQANSILEKVNPLEVVRTGLSGLSSTSKTLNI